MSIQTELERLVGAKESMRQSIINKGVDVPEDAKIEDYPEYIAQIGRVVLKELKAALDLGNYNVFPANTSIPDTYNGAAFNWVVGHYGTATMSDGSTKDGVYLFADKIVTTMAFSPNSYYNESTINTWLNSTFLSACSDTMKNLVGEISVTGSDAAHATNAKMWLMSVGEVMGEAPSAANGGGVGWDAWKIRTGLSNPSRSSNDGRIMQYNGSAQAWRTRSFASTSTVCGVNVIGLIYDGSLSYATGVIPACFIAKS